MEVAEANGIIMLFPQNLPLASRGGSSQGCWDTYGAGGEFYATHQGHQLQTLRRMIDAVLGVPYHNNDHYGIDAYSGYENNRPYRLDNINRRPYRVNTATPTRNQVRGNGAVMNLGGIGNGFGPNDGFNSAGGFNGVGGGFNGAGGFNGNGFAGAAGPVGNGFANGGVGINANGFGNGVGGITGAAGNGFISSGQAAFNLVDNSGVSGIIGQGNGDIIVGRNVGSQGGNGGNPGVISYSSVAGLGNIEDGTYVDGNSAITYGNAGNRQTYVSSYSNLEK